MNTNEFLLYNDFLYTLYTSENEESRNKELLSYLHLLVPSSYVSLLTSDPSLNHPNFNGVYCDPKSFTKAEEKYVHLFREDETQWFMRSKTSLVLKESDLIGSDQRLSSTIYKECYEEYNIYDTLQMTIVYERKFYGVVTLFHTKDDAPFTEEDITLLKSLARHLNYIYGKYETIHSNRKAISSNTKEIPSDVHLTAREKQILGLIYQMKTNKEICSELHITNHTMQKHLQNIYRKLDISSRLELFQFRL